MTITEMEKAVEGLTAEQCLYTHLHRNGSMILCPNHKLEIDEADGKPWCFTCDTNHKKRQLRSCVCADLPTGQPW